MKESKWNKKILKLKYQNVEVPIYKENKISAVHMEVPPSINKIVTKINEIIDYLNEKERLGKVE